VDLHGPYNRVSAAILRFRAKGIYIRQKDLSGPTWALYIIRVSASVWKNRITIFLATTLPHADWFSEFLHRDTLYYIYCKTVNNPITHQMRR